MMYLYNYYFNRSDFSKLLVLSVEAFLFLFLGFGFGREGPWVVDLKGQVSEITGFKEGQPPNHAQFEPFF